MDRIKAMSLARSLRSDDMLIADAIFYSEWHQTNNNPYVRAHLLAIKDDDKRIHGILNI